MIVPNKSADWFLYDENTRDLDYIFCAIVKKHEIILLLVFF